MVWAGALWGQPDTASLPPVEDTLAPASEDPFAPADHDVAPATDAALSGDSPAGGGAAGEDSLLKMIHDVDSELDDLKAVEQKVYEYGQEEEAGPDSLPGLTIIEEPENGLYVGHLKPLFEKLAGPGRRGQFIFTTHSPYFIDLFDSCLEGVHLVKPGVPSSEIKKLDIEKTGKLLDEMPLGEMHFREMLG